MNSGAQITFRDNICFVSSDDTVTMEGVSQRDEDHSEADSTGIDLGPTYSTDSEAEEEATQAATEEAKPAAEDTAATSAQETQQSRLPQRESVQAA